MPHLQSVTLEAEQPAGGVVELEQPWETGWQPVDGPAPQSSRLDTKVVNENTYTLWKSPDGIETIQKGADYYRVSPGAFNTIPPEEHFHRKQRTPGHKGQT